MLWNFHKTLKTTTYTKQTRNSSFLVVGTIEKRTIEFGNTGTKHLRELNRLYMVNKKGGWDTKMSVTQQFYTLAWPCCASGKCSQRGQTDGGTVFSNMPHQRQQWQWVLCSLKSLSNLKRYVPITAYHCDFSFILIQPPFHRHAGLKTSPLGELKPALAS